MIEGVEEICSYSESMSLPGHDKSLQEADIDGLGAVKIERIASEYRRVEIRNGQSAKRCAWQRLDRSRRMANAVPQDGWVKQDRPAFTETVEVQIHAGSNYGKRCSFYKFQDRGYLPAAKRLAQESFLTFKERQSISAIKREAMGRVKTREPALVAG